MNLPRLAAVMAGLSIVPAAQAAEQSLLLTLTVASNWRFSEDFLTSGPFEMEYSDEHGMKLHIDTALHANDRHSDFLIVSPNEPALTSQGQPSVPLVVHLNNKRLSTVPVSVRATGARKNLEAPAAYTPTGAQPISFQISQQYPGPLPQVRYTGTVNLWVLPTP